MIELGRKAKIGEYYVEVRGKTIVGGPSDVEVLKRLWVSGDVVGLKYGDVYHVFDFEKNKYKTFKSVDAIFFEYPYAEIYEEVEPKLKVKRKTVALNTRMVLMGGVLLSSVIFFLVMLLVGGGGEGTELPEVTQQPVGDVPTQSIPQTVALPCETNLHSFVSMYDYGDTVGEEKLVKDLGRGERIMVSLTRTNTTPELPIELEYSPLSSPEIEQREDGGIVINLKNYDLCVYFISKNLKAPLLIKSLTKEGCVIEIQGGCFGVVPSLEPAPGETPQSNL